MAGIPDEFEKFYLANDDVYTLLVSLARNWVARTGRDKLGFRMLWERARWEISIQTVGDDEYKLNDHWCPYYTRIIMHREYDLDDIFNVRQSEADNWMLDAMRRGII